MASLRLLATGLLLAVISVAFFRAIFIYKTPAEPESCDHLAGHEKISLTQDILDRFKGALSIKTISYSEHNYEGDEILNFVNYLQKSFPLIHQSPFVKRELVANLSLIYTVQGENEDLEPYLLTSHMDVVPAIREKWTSEPFQPVVKDDKNLYARGTIDAKHDLMSMLEAFEFLLSRGFKPQRGFYLVFGHDEESGGIEGAQTIATVLRERLDASKWNKLLYILDEGNVIITTRFPGIDADLALVGVVEKGFVTVKVSTVGAMGHGSIPPYDTAITKLSRAISKFHSNIMPGFFGQGVEREMIEIMAKYASWPYKFVYANFWLFKPLLEYIFSETPALNSIIRTSTAVTMINGGNKVNVLPDSAEAYINHRVHQLQTVDDVLKFDRDIISDPTIEVELSGRCRGPSPVAPHCDDCYGFQLIKSSTQQVYPGTVVIPSVFLAGSDSRWYVNLTDSIYKFSAIAIPLGETNLFHGHDERISLKNYENLINFFHHLIQNSDAVKLDLVPKAREEL